MTKEAYNRFVGDFSAFKPSGKPSRYQIRKQELDDKLAEFEGKPELNLEDILEKRSLSDKLSGIIRNKNLTSLDLSDVRFGNLFFINCNLSEAVFFSCTFDRLALVNCDFEKADFSLAEMKGAWIEGNAKSSSFEEADLENITLLGDFQFANFERANLQDAYFVRVKFEGANFLSANLQGHRGMARFSETTIMPNGRGHDLMTNRFSHSL